MKKILFIFSLLITSYSFMACSYPFFLANNNPNLILQKYGWYENIVSYEITGGIDSMLLELKPIEVFKADLVVEYMSNTDGMHFKGDTVIMHYKNYDVVSDKSLNGNILLFSPCQTLKEQSRFWSKKERLNFNKKRQILRKIRNHRNGKLSFNHSDGSKWLEGKIFNGKPIGVWKEYFPGKIAKNLMKCQVNYNAGLGEVYFINRTDKIIHREYFRIKPRKRRDEPIKPQTAKEYFKN